MSEHESEHLTGDPRPEENRLQSEARPVPNSKNDPKDHSRRVFLFNVSLLINGAVGVVLAVPVLGYLLGPVIRKKNSYFPEGETRLANYRNPSTTQWDGQTGDIPCWVRRVSGNQFQVFAINCAHLGCPVRWFSESKLFLCPCHGGAYYEDGERAAGPPERGLFEYKYRVAGAKLMINAGEMPTLSTPASAQSANFVPLEKIGCGSCKS
jgi:menaquinol-cytochrome c reductase iron-sulfur subunit